MSFRKNVLLINPWIYDFTAYDFWLKPLGLLYIASLIKKYTNLNMFFIDCLEGHHPLLAKKLKIKSDGRSPFLKEEVEKPQVLRNIPRKYSRYGIPLSLFQKEIESIPVPELVLLTCCMTYWYPGVQLVVELIRKKFGSVPIILGGVYATLMPEHARSATGVDVVSEGPGERKIFSLLRKILGKKVCSEEIIDSLERMPFPAFELLARKDSLPLLTSRGCPLKCTFCGVPLLQEKIEHRSISSVIQEIENDLKLWKTKNLAFYDDALLFRKEHHLLPLLQEIINKNLPLAFHTPNGLQINEVDFETALLFKRAKFESIFLSQESFNPIFLNEASHKVREGDLEKALENLGRAGYNRRNVNVYLLVGLPGQDFKGVKEDIIRVQKLGARVRLAYFSPVPGTEAWKKMIERKYLNPDDDPLLHNKAIFPYLRPDFPEEDFLKLKQLVLQP